LGVVFRGSDWKGKRLWCCQSRMALWVGLHLASRRAWDLEIPRSLRKEVILDFPEDTHGCRCRDCRFRRIYGPKTTSFSPPKGA